MKMINYLRVFALSTLAFLFASGAAAQEDKPAEAQSPQEAKPSAATQPHDRPNMLRSLGLTEEQIRQIREINVEKRSLMNEAQKRFRAANRALDEAIYADQVNDADIEARLKDVQAAQAEVAKLRYMNELSVRRILTQEQLVRFREMRQRFEQMRSNFEDRRRSNVERKLDGRQPRQDRKVPKETQQPVRPANPDKRVL